MSDKFLKIQRALLSVSDKDGLIELAQTLSDLKVEILSTGGTANAIKEAGINVKDVSDHTGFPEIMGGRVKTLHPKIHGGILARREHDGDQSAMKEQGISGIDLVVVNLYPFENTVDAGAKFEDCIENIDIGGPAMIRAAAKNHNDVTIITSPEDYRSIIDELNNNKGEISYKLRKQLAAKAFAHTAYYDAKIAEWFNDQDKQEELPQSLTIPAEKSAELRYGENPHQKAALYITDKYKTGVATATQIQGKPLSYNNINDTDAAFALVSEFEDPTIAIIKHANPCGIATAENLEKAYANALRCDPVSAFGGIIAANQKLDAATAELITGQFCEVVIAPSIEAKALEIFEKKKNLRVLTTGNVADTKTPDVMIKQITGGLLVQDLDTKNISRDDLEVVTDRHPTEREIEDMLFAFKVAKHVKSNAIIYAKNKATVGIGAGQMSRLDSSRIAAQKAIDAAEADGQTESLAKGSIVASDAFFPFADGLIAAAEAGVTAIIQPGGSVRDEEVIAAANERGLAMIFTGIRHFRH